ncbi:MAG TPA: PSD1 and planctomycete cytochrome C domain-containing protein [Verrucomicrobiae bacterium]|jgi:hypothetical protein|nr:PSD1 and planctomycete cytochrome C domain-containing protein [Verrucomicrobiae bacterium]
MHSGFAVFCALVLIQASIASESGKIGFNQAIRPILSDNCFACHGPDAKKRKGKLRLDVRDDAVDKKAIVPGKPDESEIVKRIFTPDKDDHMPPLDSNKSLTEAQKELLKEWIAQGAVYEGHWAYIPPVKPATPPGKSAIDFLVQERLKTAGLKPSSEADRRTLIRRLYFDLVGLPPKPEEVEAFENDKSPTAYSDLVEKLLSSPHYGERMAIPWLDLVRFADTIGYHSDNPRNVWPYRDYVIRAFNENKPFDQFTVEQIAGDLLPNCTQEQKVSSAFNRLLLTTEEGGAQPKDYEARMVTDRVRAIGTVWLGQTIGCANCHDHKFDPIKQRDFFSMGAFFADIKEAAIGRREDGMLVPNKREQAELEQLESNVTRLQNDFDAPHPELRDGYEKWSKAQLQALELEHLWSQLHPENAEATGGTKLETESDNSILAKGKNPEKATYTLTFAHSPNPISGLRLEALPHDSLPSKGSGRSGNGNFVITELRASLIRNDEAHALSFARASASIEQSFAAENNPEKRWAASAVIDGNTDEFGWAILPDVTKPQELVLELAEPVKFEAGDKLKIEIIQNHGHGSHTLGHFRISVSTSYDVVRAPLVAQPPHEIAEVLLIPDEKRDQGQKDKLFAYFKTVAPELASLRTELAEARKTKNDFEGKLPRCLVSVSMEKPRSVRILPRGNFLIETGDIVEPALPGFLKATFNKSEEGHRLTRLDLADWLISRKNPLTARVVANRFWKQFFGTGLSKTLDDLGAQGEPPPNQPLLDWLACEFMDNGWDVKHVIRLMVTSQAYKQTSVVSPELRTRDPYNREIAAQSRWRLEAELVRDNALAISGLLQPKIGGPSVKPYQPDGYWENLNFPVRTYDASKGADQYRRGLYTWWQRSYLHPSLTAFDAPSREECAAERNRSNIPQQALVLLNDPTYVEASRVFAARILHECSGDTKSRINWAWRQALQRPPRPNEIETIESLLTKHLSEYKDDTKAADEVLSAGFSPVPDNLNKSELAAWTSVARVIFNLHETITRS